VRSGSTAGRVACPITVDAAPVEAFEGDTVAAAMVAANYKAFCWSKADAPRGPFCGTGVCHDCLVTIDGVPSRRACMTMVARGMAVTRQSSAAVPLASAAPGFPPAAASGCDVLIVGSGPAGLATALACGPGCSVRVVDERPAPGGQHYQQPASGRGDRRARKGAALIARARRAGVTIASSTTVWGAFRDAAGALEIGALSPRGVELIRPKILVVASGAHERALPVPGWTLPGVMTVGACEGLLRGFGVTPGRRVLIAGNGPLGLRLAAELLRAGVRVVAVAEAAPAPWSRAEAAWACARAAPGLVTHGVRHLAYLRRHGVPLLHGHVLGGVEGTTHARAAVLLPLGSDGLPRPEAARRFETDIVCMGYGFSPSNELSRLLGCRPRAVADGELGLQAVCDDSGQTSLPDVFEVGGAGGFAGADAAMAQGRLAGARIRAALGLPTMPPRADARALSRHLGFQRAVRRLFAAPAPGLSLADTETVVCRCEGVTLGTLREAIALHDLTDAGMLKRATRAGMGRCQGRYCAEHLDALLHPGVAPNDWRSFAAQMPLRPVPAGALAAEVPEWRGHRRTALPQRATAPAGRLPVREAEVVVIGGGIVGLSTAWYLARAGRAVVVLDRGEPGAEASGGNAGSLHVQLLSFDFQHDQRGTPGLAVRTLPLQRDAVALWEEIERELGVTLEIRRTGGLMVAETRSELEALRAKVALEQSCGIEVDLIGPRAMYELEPAIRPGLLGGALCPGEGKINPLLGTQSMLNAARAAGVRVLGRTEVVSITRGGAGFAVETQSGVLRAGRVINAAGAWAGRIATMVGVDIPVYGAPLQIMVTEPLRPALNGLLSHAGRHLTLKQAASGGLLIGGGWTAGLDPAGRHPRPLRDSLSGNLWVACHLLPALGSAHVVRSWAAMNIDVDGAPVLGEQPGIPGLFHAVGANGYTLGPLMGRITADLILHGDAGRDISPFTASRFSGAENRPRAIAFQ
jgi:glycine/D-amino acid oxidase-like deaminating enzyme